MDFEQELGKLKESIGLNYGVNCTQEENEIYSRMLQDGLQLPGGVFEYKTVSGERLNSFYKLENIALPKDKVHEYILLKQYKELKTIRKCIVFLTGLVIAALVIILLNGLF